MFDGGSFSYRNYIYGFGRFLMKYKVAWTFHGIVTLMAGFIVALLVSGGNFGFVWVLGFILGAGLYWLTLIGMLIVWLMVTKEMEEETNGL